MVTLTDAEWELIRQELQDERKVLDALMQNLEVTVRHAGPNLNENFTPAANLNRAVDERKYLREVRRSKYAQAAISQVEALTK